MSNMSQIYFSFQMGLSFKRSVRIKNQVIDLAS